MSTLNIFSWRNKKKYPQIITKYSFLTSPWGWLGEAKVSCVRASNWYWLTVGQGLLPLPQVVVEGECYYFFCFFTFIHFPLSPLSLSFISSTIASVSLFPFSGRRHKVTHKGWRVIINPNTILTINLVINSQIKLCKPPSNWKRSGKEK